MDEVATGPASAPERVGDTLRAARERIGLSLSDVASRTRIPLRHLEGIEANDFSGLPSPTYATGFVKGYARAVGADEVALARRVRGEAEAGRRQPEYVPYELADPARVPSRGLTIVALGVALAVIVLVGLWFATDLLRPGTTASTPATIAAAPDLAPVTARPAPAPTPAGGGQVLVTATDEVWLRIYDAAGKTLHQGTLKAGEHFDVPADANDPMINVGRPDKITITLNGSQLSGLKLGDQPIKGVHVSAAALQARAAGTPAPAATPTASTLAPTASAHRPARSPLTQTQRANLDAVRNPPPPGNAQ